MHEAGTPEQITALYAALGAAQAEFPKIEKTKNAYNYKYAPMDEIEAKIRPVLIKHGLTVLHPIDHVNGKQAVGTLIVHGLGGRFWCDGLTIQEGIKMQDQGGHVTYGRRYGYCAMLGITSQDDDDAALAAAKSPRRTSSAPRRDAVAQTAEHRSTPPSIPRAASGDSGATPDPSLPSQADRQRYKAILNSLRGGMSDADLQAFLLRESGATEVRLMTSKQWETVLPKLKAATQE